MWPPRGSGDTERPCGQSRGIGRASDSPAGAAGPRGNAGLGRARGPRALRTGAAAVRSGLAGGDGARSPIRARSRALVLEESAAAVGPRRYGAGGAQLGGSSTWPRPSRPCGDRLAPRRPVWGCSEMARESWSSRGPLGL
ncbi:hypothetical protein NDU88_003341 [Pleurodeles waltl]|uniref:Uncharacterized protein n=1 Tax=Pleurodeles waltl TaxID=8319 RepID=A0AAV7UZT9_PLEWA|nr:hypothetical protein NDU88_003341 [Pleurodeles waltl]